MKPELQSIIDYIELNLKTDITASELADQTGYSLFYFYRIFQETIGMPVMQYITRRRLVHGLFAIQSGAKITDVALLYGFDTHSGFYKAFVKEYGTSPSNYLKSYRANQPYKIDLRKELYKLMNPSQIKQLLDNWDIEETAVFPIIYPNTNIISEHTWNIGDKFIIKMFLNEAALNKNLTIFESMSNAVTLLPTKENQLFLKSKDSYFILMEKATGDPVFSEKILSTSENGRFIGEIIGQIDQQLFEIKGDFPKTNLLTTVTDWALPKAAPLIDIDENMKQTYIAKLTTLYPKLPRQLIHRDLNGANILLSDEVFHLLDFDLAEENVRIFDPCYFLTSVLSEQFGKADFHEENWFDLFHEVLAGYDQVIHLSEEEKAAVPLVILAIQFICVAYFSDYDKFKHLAQVNSDITMWLWGNLEKIDM